MSTVGSAGSGSLTREQALAVRERCLKALKDRLIERANIIQVNFTARIWFGSCGHFGSLHTSGGCVIAEAAA